jgi:hypothetical protein
MQGPSLGRNATIFSVDHGNPQYPTAWPFDALLHTQDAAKRYLKITKELSAELLRLKEG